MQVDREQVIAYRVAQQGLHRTASRAGELAVLDLGVQEAMGHPAALAFAARLDTEVTPDGTAVGPGHRLALAWTLRGAPHVHRRADLDTLARALYPLSEGDALARLHETAPGVAKQGITALDQFATAVRELRRAVPRPTAKGAASTAVSAALPAAMLRSCRSCGTSHIADATMRLAALPGGLELEPGTSPPVLVRRTGTRAVRAPDAAALGGLARAYLRMLGPATVAEFAGFVDGRRADVAQAWPDDLADVRVGSRTAHLPAEQLADLEAAPAPDVVRLLGPFDPYLQARDRALIVPDKTRHKTLWPVLGRPGVVLAGGEVAGVWRTRTSGTKLTVTVEPFGSVPRRTWSAVEDEAARVATARGAARVEVARRS